MNIAVITFAVQQKSGARAPIQLALALQKKGFEVTVYGYTVLSDIDTVAFLRKQRVKVQLLQSHKFLNNLRSGIQLRKLLIKNKHDALTLHTIPEWVIAAKSTGTPCIGYYYGTQFDVLKENLVPTPVSLIFEPIVNAIIYLRSFIIVRLPDVTVAISQFTAHEAQRLFARKIEVIYLGSDHLKINTASNTGTKNNTCITIKLLSVSRLTPYKNFETIIQIINKLNSLEYDFELDIVGPPSVLAYAEKLKTYASSHIRIHTEVSDEMLKKLYRNCSIYITTDRYLFFGLPLLEAAHFGKPAIAINRAAARELIRHQVTGLVAENKQEISAYLLQLAKDRDVRDRMGNTAREYAKQFSWSTCANEWEDLLNATCH